MNIWKIRTAVQVIAVVGLNSALDFLKTGEVYGGPGKKYCVPVLNCHACPAARFACPLGAIQHNLAYRQSIEGWMPWFVLGLLGVFMAFFGRAACGWLCPFGFFQDLLARIRRKKIKLPHYIGYFRYAALVIIVVVMPYTMSALWFCRLCPAGTLTAGIPWLILKPPFPGMLGTLFYVKIGILVFFLSFSLFTSRAFCRTFCPLGAILGAFNHWSLVHLKVDDKCNQCGACINYCPVDIVPYTDVQTASCIRCMKCTRCEHIKIKIGFSNSD